VDLEFLKDVHVTFPNGEAWCQVKQPALLKARGSQSLPKLPRGCLEMQWGLHKWERTQLGFLREGK